MPMINGQKMACVPCIRGHRSTKCDHASERVMVPVRKPGRPLSTCPCPPGKTCVCGSVRVAFPKDKKCGCGINNSPDLIKDEAAATIDKTTASTHPTYRVGKASAPSRPNSRKRSAHSFSPATVERMDPISQDMAAGYGRHDLQTTGITDKAGTRLLPPLRVPAGYLAPAPPSTYSQPSSLGYGAPTTPYHMTKPLSPTTAPDSMNRYTNGDGNSSAAGCCDSKPQLPERKAGDAPLLAPQNQHAMGLGYHQRPMSTSEQAVPSRFPQPNVFSFPPPYRPWHYPAGHATWQMTDQPSRPAAMELNHIHIRAQIEGSNDEASTGFECNCGPGCQCIGCVAHPFNSQMLAYLNNAYDGHSTSVSPTGTFSNDHGLPSVQHGSVSAPLPPSSATTNGSETARVAVAATRPATSPQQVQTPSESPVMSNGEQQLSMNDFFFINMPFDGNYFRTMGDLECGGLEYLCPCGPGCECFGCEIHGNVTGSAGGVAEP